MSQITITIDTPDTLERRDFAFAIDEALRIGFEHDYDMWTVEPKTGRWIIGNKTSVFDLAGVETWAVRMTCSECSFSLNFVEGHTAQYRFCPQCGARME